MSRLKNWESLATHPWYGPLMKKLPDADKEICVTFITSRADLSKPVFYNQALLWGVSDGGSGSRNHPLMQELVLVTSTMEVPQ